MVASGNELDRRIQEVRRFNRAYTRLIGLLHEALLDSPFSLTQARVLFELAHRDLPAASDLSKELQLDAGYLSRILRGFEKSGLVAKAESRVDGRQNLLSLTARGRRAFADLDARSQKEVGVLLNRLDPVEQIRLIALMHSIEKLLGIGPEPKVPYLLRSHQPGDMGWIVHRHGALYFQEYGWNEEFEAYVAEIVANFIRNYDPDREHCWIAERDGEIVGSVFLVKQSKFTARLRLLWVEPKARGLGIGSRLVGECIRFAQRTGYRTITLWTNNVLHAARHIYKKAGFDLVREEPHYSFGQNLVAETWKLNLKNAPINKAIA
jgi:DNA-binding MarR family transcriptional regulator/GNAT superfamily N-acetyltransferase